MRLKFIVTFGAGKCMYSASSYVSPASHPPLIGYGLDGFPIYGRYEPPAAVMPT